MHTIDGLPFELASLQRPIVMGVLNVTSDSFSDGGKWIDVDDAIAHGMRLAREGADLVDVGGESTRPGAQRIEADVERDRVVPVIEGLTKAGVAVSVDTMRAEVAEAAVKAGAVIVNDVSGGQADPQMAEWLTGTDVPYVVMHWRGASNVMNGLAVYDDVVNDVMRELQQRIDVLTRAGVAFRRLIVDPGLGFAKDADHNWQLLHGMDRLHQLGRPVLIGASRKRFIGALLADARGPRDVEDRDIATDAISALAAAHRAWGVRVHDVRGSLDSLKVGQAWARGRAE